MVYPVKILAYIKFQIIIFSVPPVHLLEPIMQALHRAMRAAPLYAGVRIRNIPIDKERVQYLIDCPLYNPVFERLRHYQALFRLIDVKFPVSA